MTRRHAVTLESRLRQLVQAYPRAWRQHREEEVVSVLLEQAEAQQRIRVGALLTLDLVAHGLEARVDAALRGVSGDLRQRMALVALVTVAALSAVLLTGEVLGATLRPPVGARSNLRYFAYGPFLSVGVLVYAGYLAAALASCRARAGLGRALTGTSTVLAVWLLVPVGVLPQPRPVLMAMVAALGLLASMARVGKASSERRRAARGVGALSGLLALALLATKPLLQWSVGTATDSGNVALAMLAVALTGTVVVGLVVAMIIGRRRGLWLPVVAVTGVPLVVAAAGIHHSLSGGGADPLLLAPVAYGLLLVGAVVLRRPTTSSEQPEILGG